MNWKKDDGVRSFFQFSSFLFRSPADDSKRNSQHLFRLQTWYALEQLAHDGHAEPKTTTFPTPFFSMINFILRMDPYVLHYSVPEELSQWAWFNVPFHLWLYGKNHSFKFPSALIIMDSSRERWTVWRCDFHDCSLFMALGNFLEKDRLSNRHCSTGSPFTGDIFSKLPTIFFPFCLRPWAASMESLQKSILTPSTLENPGNFLQVDGSLFRFEWVAPTTSSGYYDITLPILWFIFSPTFPI